MTKKVLAAGGIVRNQIDEILLIYRHSIWDLPKGHLNEGETLELCAVREVKEETGLQTLHSVRFAGITEHLYYDAYLEEEVVKETHWFEMYADKNEAMNPQIQEGIEAVRWIARGELKKYLYNSYENIRTIVGKVLDNKRGA